MNYNKVKKYLKNTVLSYSPLNASTDELSTNSKSSK